MSKTSNVFMLIAAIAAGYIGGLTSQWGSAQAEDALVYEVLRARKFELLDENNNVKGALGSVLGTPVLTLGDDKGNPRLSLGVAPGNKPSLTFYNGTGKMMATFGLYANDMAGLSLMDGSEAPRGTFSIKQDGTPCLSLMDREKRVRGSMGMVPDGDVGLFLRDGNDKVVSSLVGPAAVSKPATAENGSYYGEISSETGKPKTVYVPGYYRKDGTYVRGYYRSK